MWAFLQECYVRSSQMSFALTYEPGLSHNFRKHNVGGVIFIEPSLSEGTLPM